MNGLFVTLLWRDPSYFFMTVAVVAFSICCHEYAHARMALHEGDSTAADAGHLTLNPLVQMGPISLVLICLLGIAWGAVPVNPSRFRRKISGLLVSAAGPLTNVALFVVFCVLYGAVDVFLIKSGKVDAKMADLLTQFLSIAVIMNAVLALLNLLPVPPLDGWEIWRHLVPAIDRVNREVRNGAAMMLLLLAFAFGFTLFSTIGQIVAWPLIAVTELVLTPIAHLVGLL